MRDASQTESPMNLVCMNKHLHALWGQARFGLEPIAHTETEVTVRFQWLRKGSRGIDTKVTTVDDTTIEDLCGAERDGQGTGQFYRQSGQPILSGDVFVLKGTSEADRPSVALLELQWHLIRLAAMCAAADVVVRSPGWGVESRRVRYEEVFGRHGLNDEEDFAADNADVDAFLLDDEASSSSQAF